MSNKRPVWFVRRESDNRILCVDRLWRHNTGCIECIKFYTSAARALKYGLRGGNGTAYAVYSTDRIDCTGFVTRNNY